MAETRNMHYAPQTYLQHFAQQRKGEHYIHARPKVGGHSFQTNIRNICAVRDLYMLPGEKEEDRQFVERLYNELYEAGYDDLYKLLTDEKKDTLTAKERYAIVGFVVSMFYRNNSWNNFHDKVMNDTLKKAYNLTQANRKDSFFLEEKKISITGKTLEQIQEEYNSESRPIAALIQVQAIFQLIRRRFQHDVISVIKASPGFEFITSDNPVIAKPPKSTQYMIPMDPNNSLWIPIDGQHLLHLNPWAQELDWRTLNRMSDSPIPGIHSSMNNIFQSAQADKFLLGTRDGLELFSKKPTGIFPPTP